MFPPVLFTLVKDIGRRAFADNGTNEFLVSMMVWLTSWALHIIVIALM